MHSIFARISAPEPTVTFRKRKKEKNILAKISAPEPAVTFRKRKK
jgi:hypothetical protein